MSPITSSLDQARVLPPPAAPVLRPGPVLAGAMVVGAAACGLLAWNLRAFLGRYDTLAYLLQGEHSVEMMRIRSLLLIAGFMQAASALAALLNWRLSLAMVGGSLFVSGALAGPLIRAYASPKAGLEESLIYRVRDFSAIGVLGGLFLLFLSLIPWLLDSPARGWERVLSDRVRRGVEKLQAVPSFRRSAALGMVTFLLVIAAEFLILQNFPNSSDENSYLTQARIFAAGKLWVDAPTHPEFFRARSFIMDEGGGRFFAKAFPGWAAILSLGVRLSLIHI